MNFTSRFFFICLVPAVFAFYLLPGRWRALYLLALSYGFYLLSNNVYFILLIAASAVVYTLGLLIARSPSERSKQAFMAAGVAAVVAMIVAFKAAGAWRGFLLPLGVSYYSFKLLSYLIEVYWDDEAVERDPIAFFLFPAFFPQIVSGPIQRPNPFFVQMREVAGRTFNVDQIEAGIRLILGGLMMKLLVGDRLLALIGVVGQSYATYRYSVVVVTVACFILQLYADFSGYTNIALGVGKLFGVEGPPNFNAPFSAVNIQDFWRRWHMSLTLWLTDYLFTPLSMSLRDYGQAGLIGAICLDMVIIGLWHGFTLNFLAFGLLHALFLSVTVLILARRKRAAIKTKTPTRSGRPESCAGVFPQRRPHVRAGQRIDDLRLFADLGRGRLPPGTDCRPRAERVDRLAGHAGEFRQSQPGSVWPSRCSSAPALPASSACVRLLAERLRHGSSMASACRCSRCCRPRGADASSTVNSSPRM